MLKLLVLAFLFPAVALAAPPPGVDTDSKISIWVRTTKDVHGVGCCSLADCRQTAARPTPEGGYEVWIGRDKYGAYAPDAWMPVSDDALAATSNGPPPDGRVWACFYAGRVMCFFSDGAS